MAPSQLKKGCQGVIQSVHKETHSYDVTTIGNTVPLKGIPRLLQNPGDTKLLPIGTRVAISYDYGHPIILGVLPYTGSRENNRNDVKLTGQNLTGSAAGTETPEASGNYRAGNIPNDLGPNDNIQVGEDGNMMGLLAGGINIMKSGFAEVRTHILNDLLELLCRNYKLSTDMGVSEVKNENGRVSWSFRGGTDQLTETGSDQENWTIRFDLGAVGDLFNFELTKPDGATLFKLHVNSDGKLELFALDGIDEFSGANKVSKILAHRETTIKGNDTQTIRGSQTKTINGNRTTTVSNSDTHTVGNDLTQSVMRHHTLTAGGQVKETAVGGNPLLAKPGDIARETIIVNGTWETSIGDPLNGANPAAMAGYILETFTGDVHMKVKVKGDVHLETLLGDATLETTAGNATLKTSAGVANVDGTTVNLGPVGASMANPVVKGMLHNSAFAAYTGANAAAVAPAVAATSAVLGTVAPPTGMMLWSIGPVMSPVFTAWFTTILTALNALIAANVALASAVPATLSTKSFTA